MITTTEIKPQIEEISDRSPFNQRITMGPFERGYGHTLGNALRRVMLSGIPGFAPTEVVIEGVDQQYSTLPGVTEDVIEMLLNLKGVAFRLQAGDSVEVKINKSGPGDVVAGDIELPGQATIINPEHYIAHLAKDAKLSMTIKVEGGRGYLPASDPSRTKVGPGTILLDAAFSPVRNVAIEVEDARVASRTDLDRLIIDLKTNGVHSPEEMIRYAAAMLIGQLQFFAGLDRSEMVLDLIGRRETVSDNPHIYEPLDSLNLNVRVINNLKQESILLIGELACKSEKELLGTPRLGRKSVDEIKLALAEMDLDLGMTIDNFDPDHGTTSI